MAPSSGPPRGRLIRLPGDAEIAARDWLRYWGYSEAQAVGGVGDGGVDVESSQYVVQVKASVARVGRPLVQQVLGVAAHHEKIPLFFALGGYTREALEWAEESGVGLFAFNLQGAPEPLNRTALLVIMAAGPDAVELYPETEELFSIEECAGWLKAHLSSRSGAGLLFADKAEWLAIEEEVSYLSDWTARDLSEVGYLPDDWIADISSRSRRLTTLVLKGAEYIHDQDTIEFMRQALTGGLVRIPVGTGSGRQVLALSTSNLFVLGLAERAAGISRRLAEVIAPKAILSI